MNSVSWNDYHSVKPEKEGVYLIKNDESNPPLQWACFYHPIHGWTGIGHILEKVIKYWAPWPDSK